MLEKLCSSSEYWLYVLQILNIKDRYDFQFKESYKVTSHEMDEDLIKGLSLYTNLINQLNYDHYFDLKDIQRFSVYSCVYLLNLVLSKTE